MEDLVESLLQVRLGVHPGCDSITEENEVVHHSSWIDTDHAADATKGGVLLLIVPNISQG